MGNDTITLARVLTGANECKRGEEDDRKTNKPLTWTHTHTWGDTHTAGNLTYIVHAWRKEEKRRKYAGKSATPG